MANGTKKAEIVYDIVKAEDISIAMSNSGKSTRGSKMTKDADKVVWSQTVCAVMERVDMSALVIDPTEDGIKLIGEKLKKLVADHIIATVEIPEKGKNRQGKEFDVSDAKGPKWSSWAETRRIWAYIGDIAKILAFGLDDKLYPEALKVGGRGTLLKMCKVPEGHMAAIERHIEGLQDNLNKLVNPVEVGIAHNKVNALCVNNLDPVAEMRTLVNKLDNLLGTVDPSERQAVLHDIGRLSKHFEAK